MTADAPKTGTLSGDRRRPTYLRAERDLLAGWLDFHRSTLEVKCEGLTDEQRKARPVVSSSLSLHGLVRHLAETERNWFQRIVAGQEAPRIWADGSVKDSPLVPLDDAVWEDDLETWRTECETNRRIAASLDLDATGRWRQKEVSLRSAYLHMIQEYARHNGHADLIRELIDGSVGL